MKVLALTITLVDEPPAPASEYPKIALLPLPAVSCSKWLLVNDKIP